MARTNDNFVVFDFFDVDIELNEIWVFDLFTGDAGFIAETGPNFAFPTFSSDDRFLAFEFTEFGVLNVHKIPMDESRLSSTGSAEEVLFEVQLPTWITIGDRPTAVEEEAELVPLSYELEQNFPNPFNSGTVIEYALPTNAEIRLSVYDVRGSRVAVLEEGIKPAGSYSMGWNGTDDHGRATASGVYVYRLETVGRAEEKQALTRKMVLLR